MKALLVLSLALAATAASGQAPDRSEARDGEFGAKLMITDDAQGFFTQWRQSGTPHISTTKQITRARPIEAVIVFHACVAGVDGNCHVVVHFEMTAPDGRAYERPLDAVAWKGPPAPSPAMLASEATMGFILEPEDPLGRYVITAKLSDMISGRSVTLSESVIAVEHAAPVPAPTS